MKKLSQLLESINEVDSLLEIDFKDKKAFQKYNAKHKMRPTTKVNIAGKDTTVGDATGKKSKGKGAKASSKAQAFAAISNLSDKDKKDFEFWLYDKETSEFIELNKSNFNGSLQKLG